MTKINDDATLIRIVSALLGMNQSDLAVAINLSPSHLSRIVSKGGSISRKSCKLMVPLLRDRRKYWRNRIDPPRYMDDTVEYISAMIRYLQSRANG